ncbi:hypothetical protein CANMA_005042 [Candida margitis]|uniref:uncharacterized protein n=1 Tax=Candida margitis TaxID=1775924 RepID=UPI002227BD10|nr:uncharacterized protein CANMA_005042 [Candida margitis]KAI5952941.1 hypothetical protein CANMA_005042 [Candida margitis]
MTSDTRPWGQSPTDTQLAKIVAILLNSQGFHFSEEFLSQMYELVIEYMNHLLGSLLDYTQLQRRRKPVLSDIKLVLKENEIRPSDLAEQIQYSRSFPASHRQQISAVISDSNEEPVDNERSSNEQYEITEVVPNIRTKPSYIPSYLPDLPPDYTYQSTPTYSQPLTDLKQLRMKLVQESRLTEESLYKLIESDESELKLKAQFENELDQLMKSESVARLNDEGETRIDEKEETKAADVTDTASSAAVPYDTTNKFDFIKYAQQRKDLQLRKQSKLEEQQQKRDADIFMKAELYYSPYATRDPTTETDKYFKDILNDEFKKVIASIRASEERRQKELAAQKELKEKQEREFREQNEIQFNFQNKDASDSSDLDSDIIEEF